MEKSGLIEKVSGHTNRYTLSNEYHTLVNDVLENKHKNTNGQIGGQMPSNRLKILNHIIENNYITRKELTIKVGIVSSAIQKHLKQLVKDGYIKREGKTKASHWVI